MSFFTHLESAIQAGHKLPSGHLIGDLPPHKKVVFDEIMKKNTDGLMFNVTPGDWILPITVLMNTEDLYRIKYRRGDLMVNTFPKSGTTWIQELVWTMRHNPDLNNSDASMPLYLRVAFMEGDIDEEGKDVMARGSSHPVMKAFEKLCPDKDPNDGVFVQLIEASPSPRDVRTHVPISFLNPSLLEEAKVVYLARDPRDVFISMHHYWQIVKYAEFIDDFDLYFDYFVSGVDNWYWNHIKESWKHRNHPNFHWIYYEDLKANHMEELKKLDKFLETKLSENQLKNIADYCSFQKMSQRHESDKASFFPEDMFKEDVVAKRGSFFRKGATGEWKELLTDEQQERINDWIRSNTQDFTEDFRYKM